jgi:hypothetical protein
MKTHHVVVKYGEPRVMPSYREKRDDRKNKATPVFGRGNGNREFSFPPKTGMLKSRKFYSTLPGEMRDIDLPPKKEKAKSCGKLSFAVVKLPS